jgi:hypothetical protein
MPEQWTVSSGMGVHVHDDSSREIHTGWSEHEHHPARPSLHVGVYTGGSHVSFMGPAEHVLQLLDDLRAAATAAVEERYPVRDLADAFDRLSGD